MENAVRGVFVDANGSLAEIFERQNMAGDPPVRVNHDADITSEREMCEWFNAQFDTLMDQINSFNANLAANRDDYGAPGIQQQADAVTANIDQSEDYLAPRARAFTVVTDCDGDGSCDDYIPIYEGKDFRRVWQQQSNISTSIKNHNPSGITNISIGLTNLYANGIRGSGVCA